MVCVQQKVSVRRQEVSEKVTNDIRAKNILLSFILEQLVFIHCFFFVCARGTI